MTWPVWTASRPSLIGHWAALDLSGSVWAHWWTANALSGGASPFAGTHSFFPVGMSPVLQFNLVDAVAGAPWVWLFGPRLGYNLAATTALVTTGLAGYWLARQVDCSRGGALLAGLSIESSSYLALELYEGRISQVFIVFWLLALGGLVRVIRGQGGWGLALLTGLTAALAAGVYWYHGLALVMAGAILLAASWSNIGQAAWRRIAASVGLGLILTLPMVLTLLESWSGLPGVGRMVDDPMHASNPDHLKSGIDIATQHSRWPLWPVIGRAGLEAGHQLSLITLLLGALAIFKRVPGTRRWLAIAGLGWLLALGPKLHGYHGATDIQLPFGWIQASIPAMERMWWPQRFELLAVVGIGLLAGRGLDRLIANRRFARGWVLAALLLCLVDAPLRSGVLPIKADPVPRVSAELYDGLEGALITVPVIPSALVSTRAMYIQTHHGQPALTGDGEHIASHRPAGFDAIIEDNAVLHALRTLALTGAVRTTISPQDITALIDMGFVYAVADPAVYPGPEGRLWTEAHRQFFQALFGPPTQQGGGGAAWTIHPVEAPIPIDIKRSSGSQRRRR